MPDIGVDTLTATISEITEAIAQLQQEIAAAHQAARADGFDSATARLMVQPRHANLADAQRNLDRLTAVQAAVVTPDSDAGKACADTGHQQLPDLRAAPRTRQPRQTGRPRRHRACHRLRHVPHLPRHRQPVSSTPT